MKKLLFIPLILILLSTVSCNSSRNTEVENLSDSIVVIFNNPPDQKWFYYNSGSYSGQFNHATLKFIGKGGLFENFDPSSNGDTITIPCFGQNHIVISHKYKGLEMHNYLIKRGDTVVINYDFSNFPLLTSKLSCDLTEMYNLNYKVKNRTVNYGFEPQTILNNMDFGLAYLIKKKSKTIPEETRKALQDLLVNYIDLDSILVEHQKYVDNFTAILDSLELSGKIDSTYLKFYRNRLSVINEQGKIKELFQNPKSKKISQDDGVSGFVLNDSLAYNYQYQNQLNGYIYKQTQKEGVK